MSADLILRAEGLKKHFPVTEGVIWSKVVGWVKEVSRIPVWAKMTPNVGNPAEPALAAKASGADCISAINTILSVVGIDPKTLRPQPTVEGHSVPGGYSGQAVRPIALRQVMEIARATKLPISGMGGVETGWDAAQFRFAEGMYSGAMPSQWVRFF